MIKPDLETLKTEIEDYLKTQEFAVFHGYPRLAEPASMVHWDSEEYPDFKSFLELSRQLDVRLMVFHHRRLSSDFIDQALEQLEVLDLPDDEYVEFGRRLREMRVFEGFTSAVELSFEYQSRIYFYTRRAEWYEELLDIADEIDDYAGTDVEDIEDLDDDLGPYFSKN
jgi:hypothetical protein